MISYNEYQRVLDRLTPDPRHALAFRRAEHLDLPDRIVVQLALSKKASYRQIAGLLGVTCGTACRRAWRIADRLHDPLVIRLLERPGPLRPEVRQVGIEYFLHRKSIDQLVDLHQMPKTKVRAILDFLRIWSKS